MKILLAILFSLLISCESKKDDSKQTLTDNNPFNKELSTLISETESLEDKFNRNIILRSATTRQRTSFTELVFATKKFLLILRERPNDHNSLIRLFNTKSELEAMPTQARDVEFLNSYLNDINQVLFKLIEFQGRNITDLNWEVWHENFNGGIGLFTTFANRDLWAAANRNRQGYISARTRKDKSWLISPLINLENITNPAFSLNQVINIKKNEDSLINSDFINKNCLKILVSENYEFGDPESATWEELNTNDFPLVEDFNAHSTQKMSLSKFDNRIISIAFVLDLSQVDIGGHGLLWQINEMKLFGAKNNSANTELPLIIERKDPTVYTFKYNFANGVGNFIQLRNGENPAEFLPRTRNEDTYLEVNGFRNKSNGVIYFISPVINLTDKNYYLRVRQSRNFYEAAAQEKKYIRVLVGVDNPKIPLDKWEDIELIEWKELEMTNVPPGNNWTVLMSDWAKLNFLNQNIRIAFRYESGNGITQYPNWSLYNMEVKEEEVINE